MDEHLNPYQAPETAVPLAKETTATAYRQTFQSAHRWGIATCLFFGFELAVAGSAIVLQGSLLWIYGSAPIESAAESAVQIQNWLYLELPVAMAVRFATGTLFLIWLWRSYRNLNSLGHESLDWKPFAAVLCCIIPLLNLFVPFVVMRELWWRSEPDSPQPERVKQTPTLLKCWWGAWVSATVVGFVVRNVIPWPDSFAYTRMLLRCDIMVLTGLAVAALLAVRIILQVDHNQLRRHEWIEGGLGGHQTAGLSNANNP